jgi:hypothetical protein
VEGRKIALDNDTLFGMHCETVRLDSRAGICSVDFSHIPDGLNMAELEEYSREHRAWAAKNLPISGRPRAAHQLGLGWSPDSQLQPRWPIMKLEEQTKSMTRGLLPHAEQYFRSE